MGRNLQCHLKYILKANSSEPDQTLHSASSDMVLHCLLMSHKIKARLIWVNLHAVYYIFLGVKGYKFQITFFFLSLIINFSLANSADLGETHMGVLCQCINSQLFVDQ